MIRPETSNPKSLSELARFLGIEVSDHKQGEILFTGIASDTRSVRPGDLFIALPGSKSHGAAFIVEISAAGAVAVLTDSKGAEFISGALPTLLISEPRRIVGDCASWFYGSPSQNILVAGVTGTNGKTTTTALLNQIWKYARRETGLIGTIGIEIGAEVLPTSFTTPEAADLQTLFAVMQERHVRNVAMEVSSHAITMNRINGTRFKMVGFTNLTQDHLDFHDSMAEYFAAKRKLFTSEFAELGFINIDDAYGAELFAARDIPMISLSRSNAKAEWYFESAEMIANGYSVTMRGSGGIQISGELGLIGDHNLDNLLMAVAMAFQSGVDPLVIGNSLRYLVGAPGRLERVGLGQDFIALVDYGHTPDAVERTLATLRKCTPGRIISVLGCGGDRDKSKRPIMGKALQDGSNIAIFTSDNPRSEDASLILREMVAGLVLTESNHVILDRREAIALAVASAQPGDCIVVLGKGHETGQETAGVIHPFDDRLELARAIEELA